MLIFWKVPDGSDVSFTILFSMFFISQREIINDFTY